MTEQEKYYVVEALDNQDRQHFTCGVSELDSYLKRQASQDTKKNVSVTYVIREASAQKVLGFYTLSSIGILPGELTEDIIKKLPKYPLLPGALLARLAIDISCKGQGLGARLLIDACKRTLTLSKQIGICAVVVEAKNEDAARFYKHFRFIEIPSRSNKLFLPIKTISSLELGD